MSKDPADVRDEVKELQRDLENKHGLKIVSGDLTPEEQIALRDELTRKEELEAHLAKCRQRIVDETPKVFQRPDIQPPEKVRQWLEDLWTLDRHDFAASTNGLVLVGRPGSGKTQTMWLIVRDLLEHGWEDFRLEKCSKMFDELKRLSDNRQSDLDYIRRLCDIDILLLDDLGAKKLTEFREVKLQDVLDDRCEKQLITVISTNIGAPAWAEFFGDRNASRIGGMCRTVLYPKRDHRTGIDYK